MKKILLIIILLIAAFAGKAQNLVQNGDFEQFTICPTGFSQIDLAIPWMNPSTTGSPDYYNQCATVNFIDVPDNFWGYQPALSGDAYSGIYIYLPANIVREYIEAPLTEPLSPGTCYHFEMYINLPNSCQYTSDAIGIYFSDTAITGVTNYNPLPFTPQIINLTANNPDTLNWTLVSGTYTAIGGENHLLIGNFNDNPSTNATLINSSGSWVGAYFFIDDVSLIPCATGIEEQNNNEAITIYPNPVKDEFKVSGLKFKVGEKAEIKIYDTMGKVIYLTTSLTSDFRLPTSAFQKGIYFIEINNGKEAFRKKFIKE